ncbi:hypothetical protein [Ralstonia pseudosolanacearum]|uniref:hypothetical protein n=1 Tax=Ralstonia pseudosolanacearum TaxID=1310165 RepID=UPI001FF83E16|nr:hypothetical protein [Ralstonia pseudosolanacearum]
MHGSQYLSHALEVAYQARLSDGTKPTGMRVSPALWKELVEAEAIVHVRAQIRFTSTSLPPGAGLPVLPIDATLPTYNGTIVHVEPSLSDAGEFEFSPG